MVYFLQYLINKEDEICNSWNDKTTTFITYPIKEHLLQCLTLPLLLLPKRTFIFILNT